MLQYKHHFIFIAFIFLIMVGCAVNSHSVTDDVPDDIKEAFITIYGTYNYEGRYETLLHSGLDDEKLRIARSEYYSCIRNYVNDAFYLKMIENREISKYENYAHENGLSYRTDSIEFEEYSINTDSITFSFIAHIILTDTDKNETRGTVTGQISVGDKDGLISDFYLSPTGFRPVK